MVLNVKKNTKNKSISFLNINVEIIFLKQVTLVITLGIDKTLKKQFQTKTRQIIKKWIFYDIVVNILLLVSE